MNARQPTTSRMKKDLRKEVKTYEVRFRITVEGTQDVEATSEAAARAAFNEDPGNGEVGMSGRCTMVDYEIQSVREDRS
jgi:hypothetical protein